MTHYKQLFKEKTLSGIFIGMGFSLTVLLFGLAYAAVSWGSLPSVVSGSGLTATAWNDLVTHVNQSVKQASPVITVSGSNVGIGTVNPGQKLSISGTVESTSGGFKFPDGTVQTTGTLVQIDSGWGGMWSIKNSNLSSRENHNFWTKMAECN